MKKTLITLLALAGAASADVTYNLFDTQYQEGWTRGDTNSTKNGTPAFDKNGAGALKGNGSWGRGCASYDISDITLSDKADWLTVSFTLQAENTGGLLTGAIVGTNTAIVAGPGNYSADVYYGTTSTLNADWYNMQKASGFESETGTIGYVSGASKTSGIFTANTPLTLTTEIAWNDEKSQFVATLSYGANKTELASYDLGSTYTLDKIVLSFDNGGEHKFTAMSVTASVIPEPTTATLSLLALAGLAARRRRSSL